MMGGENYKGVLQHDESELIEMATKNLRRHLRMEPADKRLEAHARIHRKCIPQYNIGHAKRLAKMESLLQTHFPRLRVTGNAFYGVGISDCIAHADSLVSDLELE